MATRITWEFPFETPTSSGGGGGGNINLLYNGSTVGSVSELNFIGQRENLVTISSATGNIYLDDYQIRVIGSNIALAVDRYNYYVIRTILSNNVNITLPDLSTVESGLVFKFKNIGNAEAYLLPYNSSQSIDNVNSIHLAIYDYIEVVAFPSENTWLISS